MSSCSAIPGERERKCTSHFEREPGQNPANSQDVLHPSELVTTRLAAPFRSGCCRMRVSIVCARIVPGRGRRPKISRVQVWQSTERARRRPAARKARDSGDGERPAAELDLLRFSGPVQNLSARRFSMLYRYQHERDPP